MEKIFNESGGKMKVIFTKQPKDIVKTSRKSFKEYIKLEFIRFMAYRGKFEGVFTKEEISDAKKGHLPRWCSVHHILPLSGVKSEVNQFGNLVVLSNKRHEQINKECYDPQLRYLEKMKVGETVVLVVPMFQQVDRASLIKDRPFKVKGYDNARQRD